MKLNWIKKTLYTSLLAGLFVSSSLVNYFCFKDLYKQNNQVKLLKQTKHIGLNEPNLRTNFSNDTNLTPQQLGFKLVPIGKEEDGVYIKMPDFSLNQKGANEILQTYASLPSNIITNQPVLKQGIDFTSGLIPDVNGNGNDLEDLEDLEGLDALATSETEKQETTNNDENEVVIEEENVEVNSTNNSTSYFDNLALNSIFSILEIDQTKYRWFVDKTNNTTDANAPIAYNLSNRSTYLFNRQNFVAGGDNNVNNIVSTSGLAPFTLTPNESLPAFELSANNDQLVIDQNYLDQNGILAIQLVLSDRTNPQTKHAFYILISGFNVRLDNNSNGNNPILANADYLNSVNSISDQTLLNSLNFQTNATNPTSKTIVENSRTNNPATGSIDLQVSYEWDVSDQIKFRSNFVGVNSPDSLVRTEGIGLNDNNQIRANTNWTRNYTFSGFVAASAFNNQQTLVLASSLAIGLLSSLLLAYLVIYLIKRFIAKRR